MDPDLIGTPTSPGLLVGTALIVPSTEVEAADWAMVLGRENRQKQLELLDASFARLVKDIDDTTNRNQKELERLGSALSPEKLREHESFSSVLLTYKMLASDAGTDGFLTHIRYLIERGTPAAAAVETIGDLFVKRLTKSVGERIGGEFSSYVVNRLIQHLHDCPDVRADSLENIPAGSVLIAKDLRYPDFAGFAPQESIVGYLTGNKSVSDHLALCARNLGLPAVSGVPEAYKRINAGDRVVVDGATGAIWINPSPELLEWVERHLEQSKKYTHLIPLASNVITPRDGGPPIRIRGNASLRRDLAALREIGQFEIGLDRTELKNLRTEDAHFVYYCELIEFAQENPGEYVPPTIRTVDIGEDKSNLNSSAFGDKGIRYSLKHPEEFKIQLKALLRAAHRAPIRVMLPMISSATDIEETQLLIEEAKTELKDEGKLFADFELGAMIETPAAVLNLNGILRRVSFVSIGSNDLAQYIRAESRENGWGLDDPALIKVIGRICEIVQEYNQRVAEGTEISGAKTVSVSICGGVCAQPFYVPILVGLGITEMSMRARGMQEVCDFVQGLDYEACRELVRNIIGNSKVGYQARGAESTEEAILWISKFHHEQATGLDFAFYPALAVVLEREQLGANGG